MESPLPSTHPSNQSQQRVDWNAQSGAPGSLPVSLTLFVGREDEIALATSLLQRPDLRLLTLTGPGGIGKTRLSIEIAAACDGQFPDGVTFVSLASIQDPAMVMMTVAAALGLEEIDRAGIDDRVAFALGSSRALLVVDNFEHVIGAAPALTRVLSRCPNLKVMVTSRTLLRVEGEFAIPVPPLVLPKSKTTMTPDDWLRVPVIRLFIERARAVEPSLTWSADDIERLVEICKRLDGLPLAVELAATRVRHFTLREINDRLNKLLPLLIDGSRDHPTRLQTMRNAIAWSHDLLSSADQALLRHASIFSGGFTLEAITEVTRDLDAHPSDPVVVIPIEDRLSMLIDSSLLIRDTSPVSGIPRYRMLETIREFALEQLGQHGQLERAQRAHATYFTTFAVRREIAELMPENVTSMDQILADQDNLRSALRWLFVSSDRELFGRLVAALGGFWLAQSNYQEGRFWFERALAVQPAPAAPDLARILVSLGMAEFFQEAYEPAGLHLKQGVESCRKHGEGHRAAQGLIGLAGLAAMRGDGERSMQLLGECRDAIAAMPDPRLAAIMSGWVSINRAVAARVMGNGDAAERHIEDALGRFEAEQFNVGIMMALGDLGDLARDRGDWVRAGDLYNRALAGNRPDQAKRIVIEIIESVAIVAAHAGQWQRSVTLLGAAEGLRERIGLRYRQPKNRLFLDEAVDIVRRSLPAETFSAAWHVGRNLTESQAIARTLDPHDSTVSPPAISLTAREAEILRLLATGMTDPEIADALFISVRTVEHHVANMFRKLGVRTRTAATSTAIAAGLVTAGESA